MDGLLPADGFDLEEILAGLERWVDISSPTVDAGGVNRMMDEAQRAMEEIGATTERRSGKDGYGDSVMARMPWGDGRPGILVLCHLDTVHAPGTFERDLDFRREDDRAYGPGILDMKGGTFLAYYALRQIVRSHATAALPLSFLFVPDEEVGTPSTRDLIESHARRERLVLVPEPAQEGADVIIGRWAFQRFIVRARGKPAHAGATLAAGRSAIREIAEQIVDIESMSNAERNLTLSTGIVSGGTFVNVVPATCEAEVLVVTEDPDDFEEIGARMRALRPKNGGIELEVETGPYRPLFTPNAGTLELFEQARSLAREIGFDLEPGIVGGGSDGNFTGALGNPTLDGLGPCGAGFHTEEEHVLLDSLIPRARLLSGLMLTLT
ncbi:MAG TPA: M20/M25/M40 family metallo-hydrolase [Thermoleophilaceae bacterium]|nr:M20/M25/M40 family metallo-hydrolase [Thermoleophilaceae bacterium]